MEDAVVGETITSSIVFTSSVSRGRIESGVTECSYCSSTPSSPRRYLSEFRDTLPASVKDLISLEDTPTTLRATRLSEILRNFGSVFRSSRASDRHFQRSEPVDRIDYFLSHNWVVARWRKVIALTIYFNFDIASGCVIIWCLIVAVGYITRICPAYEWDNIDDAQGPIGQCCGLVVGPVFFTSLLFSHHIGRCLGCPGPRFFLDKTCIPQDNEVLKRRSIEKLGAFLCESNKMVALMTKHYLTKLWTIYEVGAFVCLQPTENIVMLPVSHAVTLWIVLFAAYLWGVVDLVLERVFWVKANGWVTSFLLCVAASAGLGIAAAASNRWAKRMNDFKKKILQFRLAESTCSEQGDRELVYRNIAALMDASHPREFHNQEQSLAAFERMIRTELLVLSVRSVQAQQWHYKHFAMIGFLAFGGAPVDVLENYMQGCSALKLVVAEVWYLSGALIYIPLSCLATLHFGRLLMDRRGLRVVLAFIALWTICATATLLEIVLVDWAFLSDLCLALKLVHTLIMICLTRLAFWINRQVLQRIPDISAVAQNQKVAEGPPNKGPEVSDKDVEPCGAKEDCMDETMTATSTRSWN